ncbi:hypothetical protein Clacol_008280 [Clathrus columnatus]|uniref:Fe2OG dioxygenase domain-containing protein n=1 Tax=Clathrus columnatus TaxID=1419009 RepID=A0AAV5AMW2_9AGAM|nr:hypothetical protein Clacol_008280 [Clathrus columnatus]
MDVPPIVSVVPPFDLKSFRVPSDVDEAFYIPNFITPEEEEYLLRKPHEDGPGYHPVVATISLGSHAIFHYHRYRPEQAEQYINNSTLSAEGSGKLIDPQSVLSLLLEPRSLVITTKNLYRDYLHSIEPVEQDIIAPASVRGCDPGNNGNSSNHSSERESSDQTHIGYQVANWDLLADEENRCVAKEGGTLHRKIRVSMTCRDVEKILLGKGLGFGISKVHS